MSLQSQLDALSVLNIVIGTGGNDYLIGTAGIDEIFGLAGRDILEGGGGPDVLDGGLGFDMATYQNASSGVWVDLLLGQGLGTGGEAFGDVLISIEGLKGSRFDDTLLGDTFNNLLVGLAGDDTIFGHNGNDRLVGDAGADDLSGGLGRDWAMYMRSNAGVTVNLDTGLGSGGHAQGDTLSGIENLSGSRHDDHLTGDDFRNVLIGKDGDDTLIGMGGHDVFRGDAGADSFFGGDGTDTVTYAREGQQVIINFSTGIHAGAATGDTFSSIEKIIGTDFNDSIVTAAGRNIIFSGDGDDFIDAGNGHDTLQGGAGADFLHGGAGIDTAAYWTSDAGVTVFTSGGLNTGGHAQGDVLSAIENVVGSDHNDVITGDALQNRLRGLDGNDVLTGRGGRDDLDGGHGADRFCFVDLDDHAANTLGPLDVISDYAGSNQDRIRDFHSGVDLLQFEASEFSGLVFNTNSVAVLDLLTFTDTAFAYTGGTLYYVSYEDEAHFLSGNATVQALADLDGVALLTNADLDFV